MRLRCRSGYQGDERDGRPSGTRDSEVGRIDTTTPPASAATPTRSELRAWADWIIRSLLAQDPFSYCAVLVPDATADALLVVGERWLADIPGVPVMESAVQVEGTACGRVFRTGAPVLVADTRQHPGYRAVPGATMRSELAVPVLRDGLAIAVIDVASPRVGGLDIADLDRLTTCASEAAAAAPRPADPPAPTS